MLIPKEDRTKIHRYLFQGMSNDDIMKKIYEEIKEVTNTGF